MKPFRYDLKLLIVLLVIIFPFTGRAQLAPIDMPKMNPVDPVVAAFARYGDIPVNFSTGVPNISIPLFDIKSRTFNLPVDISYHASGIKVQDIATPVGLGWNLNVGAFVTSYHGAWVQDGAFRPNLKTSAELTSHINSTASSYDVYDFMEGLKQADLESDRHYFNLGNGKSGFFYYDYQTEELRLVPHSAIKIEKLYSNNMLSGFKFVDTDGTIFIMNAAFSTIAGESTTFYVSKIISADLSDSISFSYNLGVPDYVYPVSKVMELGPWVVYDPQYKCDYGTFPYSQNYENIVLSQNAVPVHSLNVSTITTNLATYQFTYANDRLDISKTRLVSIDVYDNVLSERKNRFEFEHSYFGTSYEANLRLKLDKLKIYGKANQDAQVYSFKYNSQSLPRYATMDYWYYHEDYWGYYNGGIGSGLVPSAFLPANQRSGNCLFREPNHDAAKACMLEEIEYPTGGKTTFLFEPNEAVEDIYDYQGDMAGYASKLVGGFRIKQIINYQDDNIIASKKTYDYHQGGIARHITKEMFWYPQRYFFYYGGSSNTTCGAWSGGEAYQLYRDQYFGVPMSPLTIASSYPIVYRDVTEYEGDVNNNSGKTHYSYDLPKSFNDYASIQPHPFSAREYYTLDRGADPPLLIGKEVFRKTVNDYQRVYALVNHHTAYKVASYQRGVSLKCITTYVPQGQTMYNAIYQDRYDFGTSWESVYWFDDLKVATDVDLLTSSTEYKDGVSSITVYNYGNLDHLMPTSKKYTSGKNENMTHFYKYPHDFAGDVIYNEMKTRNMINIVNESIYKGNKHLSSVFKNYQKWGANLIALGSVESKNLDAVAKTRIRYNGYDHNGRITDVAKENDINNAYIWGYKNSFVIAEIRNATSKDVFYTSFEEGDGDSSSGDGKTGRKSKLNGFNKTITGLSNGKYVLSYWQKNGNSWVFHKNDITVSANTYNINLSGQIDEIRFHPENAQMITYTYDPLTGITSKCDQANRTIYYKYDDFSRLMLVRDQDNNILKRYDYKYKDQ